MKKRLLPWVLLLLSVLGAAAVFGYFKLPPLPKPWEYGNVTIDRLSGSQGQKPVTFSHWSHRRYYTCRVCHFELAFVMGVNETEITEKANRNGEYCGACHNGEIAFGHTEENCRTCHDGGKGPYRKLFQELADLPPARFGNEIDWVEALALGKIAPKNSLYDDYEPVSYESEPLKLEAKWTGIPPAYFPHEEHQSWHDCADCHPDLFNIKKRTTEHFEMVYNLEGKFCGVCHLRVAFPFDDCKGCHPDIRGRKWN